MRLRRGSSAAELRFNVALRRSKVQGDTHRRGRPPCLPVKFWMSACRLFVIVRADDLPQPLRRRVAIGSAPTAGCRQRWRATPLLWRGGGGFSLPNGRGRGWVFTLSSSRQNTARCARADVWTGGPSCYGPRRDRRRSRAACLPGYTGRGTTGSAAAPRCCRCSPR